MQLKEMLAMEESIGEISINNIIFDCKQFSHFSEFLVFTQVI